MIRRAALALTVAAASTAILAAAIQLPSAGPAQSPATDAVQAPRRPSYKAAIDVITVTVSVTDAEGRLVPGLSKDDFVVFDDGVEQPVTQFVGQRVPVSLGVVLDVSDSMTGKRIDDARGALDRFVGELLSEEDEAFLMVFNHRPRVVSSWTPVPSKLRNALDGVIPTGGTAVYDALGDALEKFGSRRHQRAAIVLISDGADTASDRDLRTLRSSLRRTDAFVYAIAIDPPDTKRINIKVDAAALNAITTDSGGYTEVVHDSAELPGATQRIAEELNHQYLLGYMAPHGSDGEYHSIRVRAKQGSYRVRSRKGYVAERESR